MEQSKIDKMMEVVNKSLETVSKGVQCPFTGCSGIIGAIDARSNLRWYRLNKPGYGLPAGSWTLAIEESRKYTLICSVDGAHQTTFKYEDLSEDFKHFLYCGVKPYIPGLKRKVH